MRTDNHIRNEMAAVSLGAILCTIIVFTSGRDGSLLAASAGFVLVLFLCGYPLACVMMHWCNESELFVQIILAVVFSIMVSIGTGVLLHYSWFDITVESVAGSLMTITILTSVLCILVTNGNRDRERVRAEIRNSGTR